MAESADEDMFGEDGDELNASREFSPDLFESCSDWSIDVPEPAKESTSIGFAPSEEVPTVGMLYKFSRSQEWPRGHVLAARPGPDALEKLTRAIFGERAEAMGKLPQLASLLQQLLSRNRKANLQQLAKRCVKEGDLGKDLHARRGVVKSFLLRAAAALVPRALMGGPRNWRVLQAAAQALVHVDHGRPLLLGTIMRQLAVGKVHWLAGYGESADRSAAMALLMKWLVCQFFVKLIACHFYATHTPQDPCTTLFFHKPVWMQIEDAALNHLVQTSQLLPLDAADAQEGREPGRLTLMKMRLLPKTNGTARPIMFTSSRLAVHANHEAVKALLQHLALRGRQGAIQPGDPRGLEEVLLHGRQRFPQERVLVTVDIQDAFGSVQHLLLAKVLDDLAKELLQGGPPKHRQLERTLRGKKETLTEIFSVGGSDRLCQLKSQGWAVVTSEEMDRTQVADLLVLAIRSISQLQIQYGSRWFLFTNGLPQGGPLSPLLCEIYYNAMDRQHLAKFTQQGILVRAVDDYLFITDDVRLADEFKERLEAGFPDFNCAVNAHKTQSTAPPRNASSVSFCGLKINAATLGVEVDLGRYKGKDMGATSGNTAIPLGAKKKIEYLCALSAPWQMSRLLKNPQLNGSKGVATNVQAVSLLLGHKFVALAERLLGKQPLEKHASSWALGMARKTAKKAVSPGCMSFSLALCVAYDSLAWCLRRGRGRFGSTVLSLMRLRKRSAKKLSANEQRLLAEITVSMPCAFREVH